MAQTVYTRDEVLAWMSSHGEGPTAASKHFGIPSGTIKCWVKRLRDTVGTAPPRGASRSNITVLPTPAAPPVSPPAKVALPLDLVEQAEHGVRLRMARLCDPELIRGESSKDLREGIRAILESYDVFPSLDKKDDDLSTPEAREAALAELKALPDNVRKKVLGS